jgi:succinate dehydrogenase / fumarate reductase membrane anchor subunit
VEAGMSANARFRDPLRTARGLGAAKSGVGHFWWQRLTALALLLLAPWFVWRVASLAGHDLLAVRATLASPFDASLLLAFVVALFWHAKLGVQVVIEDYIHTRWLEVALQVLVTFACILGTLLAVVSIGRIAFTA